MSAYYGVWSSVVVIEPRDILPVEGRSASKPPSSLIKPSANLTAECAITIGLTCNDYLHNIYVRRDPHQGQEQTIKETVNSLAHPVFSSYELLTVIRKAWADRRSVCWPFWPCWRPSSRRTRIRLRSIISLPMISCQTTNCEISTTTASWTPVPAQPTIRNSSENLPPKRLQRNAASARKHRRATSEK